MKEELKDYLVRQGYNDDDACEIELAYAFGGIEYAVQKFKWADDEEHDYTRELRNDIKEWLKEFRQSRHTSNDIQGGLI